MKKILVLLVLIPALSYSQSKRKKRQMEEKANAELVASLRSHVQYLADDKLEGRRTGTRGEELAMQYIINQYQQMGLAPAGSNGYIQEFSFDEGKQVEPATILSIDGRNLKLTQEYIPLAFSANKKISGTAAIALNEPRQPWFKDLKDILEENKTNPHFDIEEEIKKITAKAAGKGATALFLYNSSPLVDNVQFNKNDKTTPAVIPVVYITRTGFSRYFSDASATLPVELTISFRESSRKVHNLVGFIDNKAANTIILGAHYDHLGYGEGGGALDTGRVIHNGADDNASGTAALIELARMLKKSAPAGNNYLIMNFSGEEMGLLGSKYWLENPTRTITPNYMINMDMVGRYDTAHKLTIGGYGTSPVWGPLFAAEKNNLLVKFDSTGSGPSDHAAFYRKDIPVLFLFTGSHSDYHKASDDWDKINYDGEKDIVKLVYRVIEAADKRGKLAFTKTAEQKVGNVRMNVTLGVIPDYGFTGTGLRIDGVSPGKTGEKIGLQAGDILLQLGDHKFANVYSYMEALGKFTKGQKAQLRIKRGTEEKTFDVEL